VLQTLTLIQQSDDPVRMVALARRQERELRNWLDPDRASRTGGGLRGRLDELIGELEQRYPLSVDVVAVGDCLLDDRVEALLAAAREALVNAAKHSGADRVDCYVEVTPDHIEVFVRDRGKGFDPAAVGSDRRGLRDSIERRMQRIGGRCRIDTELGLGTEVELMLPLLAPDHLEPR
jgi:signal transduction histidine kinase